MHTKNVNVTQGNCSTQVSFAFELEMIKAVTFTLFLFDYVGLTLDMIDMLWLVYSIFYANEISIVSKVNKIDAFERKTCICHSPKDDIVKRKRTCGP